MRGVLGPLAANLLLAGCGLTLLGGLGQVRRSALELAAALGLAFLCGAAAVGQLTILALVAGIPFTALTVTGVAIAISSCAIAVMWRRGVGLAAPRQRRPGGPRGLAGYRGILLAHPILTAFVLVFGIYAVIGAVRADVMPMSLWDGWAIWARKAILVTDFSHLPAAFFNTAPYGASHPDYPLLLPLLEATWFRFADHVDTQAVHIELWLLLVAFVWAAAFVLARHGARAITWAPLLLLVSIAGGTWTQLLSGSADVPLAIFAGLGVLLAGYWTTGGRGGDLALAALLLAAGANTKNEGLPIALLVLLAAGVVSARSPTSLRRLALAAGSVVIATVPWHLWTAIHHVPADPDVPLARAFDLPYLFARADRIWLGVKGLHNQLANQNGWLYVLPIGAATAIASLVWGVARRAAGFYLLTGVLMFLMYLWAYWLSPEPIRYYVITTDYRVIDVIVFVGLAAALHLPGESLAASSDTPRIRSSVRRRRLATVRRPRGSDARP